MPFYIATTCVHGSLPQPFTYHLSFITCPTSYQTFTLECSVIQRSPHPTPVNMRAHYRRRTVPIDPAELARRINHVSQFDQLNIQTDVLPQQSSSPISALPAELLAEIFIFCLPTDRYPIPTPTDAPLLLTQIWSLWRSVALSLPELWTAIHINYKGLEDIPATTLWLSRSADQPLSLSIAIDFGEKPQQEILDAICRHSARWKQVRFDFRHLYCPPMYALNLAEAGVPTLSTFEFHARDISITNISPITCLLSDAPQLREVTWVDDMADTDTLLELPLPRLRRLSLAMEHGSLDYLEVLDQCANLEHIRITRPCHDALPARPPLLLSKLTSLNISYDLTEILDHLVLPALKHVRIHAELDKHSHWLTPQLWDSASFVSMLDRSGCFIETLWVNAPMVEDTLVICLRQTSSSLKELCVGDFEVGDTTMELLTPHTKSFSWLCPQLTEISFDKIASSLLTEMVEARLEYAGGCKLLRKIRVPEGHPGVDRMREMSVQRKFEFTVDLISRKESRRGPRKSFFRKKLCSSR